MKEPLKAAFALLLVGALGWVVYEQATAPAAGQATAFSMEPPPEADATRLLELESVAAVQVTGILAGESQYDLGGRNLFQFGPPKPPPPSAAELEAARKAEEERLRLAEIAAKARAEEEQKRLLAENEKRAKDAEEAMKRLQDQQKVAQAEQKRIAENPPPPAIPYKLIGWLGPPERRIAVLQNGTEIVLGRRGDVIEGKFKVLKMGIESVEMGYTDPAHKDARKRIDLGS
jgi:hypothetical protein